MMVAMVESGVHVFLKFGDNGPMNLRDLYDSPFLFLLLSYVKPAITTNSLRQKLNVTCFVSLLLHHIAHTRTSECVTPPQVFQVLCCIFGACTTNPRGPLCNASHVKHHYFSLLCGASPQLQIHHLHPRDQHKGFLCSRD